MGAEILKLIIVLLYFILFLFRKQLSNKIKHKGLKESWEALKEYCKIRYNNLFTSILIPIIAISGLWIFLAPHYFPGPYSIHTIFFGPIFEELVFRGIFLGMGVILGSKILFEKMHWKRYESYKPAIIISGILIISIVFSYAHYQTIDIRYVGSVIFCVLYVIDKKNLLPAILAHSLNNLFAALF